MNDAAWEVPLSLCIAASLLVVLNVGALRGKYHGKTWDRRIQRALVLSATVAGLGFLLVLALAAVRLTHTNLLAALLKSTFYVCLLVSLGLVWRQAAQTTYRLYLVVNPAASLRLHWLLSAQMSPASQALLVIGLFSVPALTGLLWAILREAIFADVMLGIWCFFSCFLGILAFTLIVKLGSLPSLARVSTSMFLPLELVSAVLCIESAIAIRFRVVGEEPIPPSLTTNPVLFYWICVCTFLMLAFLMFLPVLSAWSGKMKEENQNLTWDFALRYFLISEERVQFQRFLRFETSQVESALALVELVVLGRKSTEDKQLPAISPELFVKLFLDETNDSCLFLWDLTPDIRASARDAVLAETPLPSSAEYLPSLLSRVQHLGSALCQIVDSSELWSSYQRHYSKWGPVINVTMDAPSTLDRIDLVEMDDSFQPPSIDPTPKGSVSPLGPENLVPDLVFEESFPLGPTIKLNTKALFDFPPRARAATRSSEPIILPTQVIGKRASANYEHLVKARLATRDSALQALIRVSLTTSPTISPLRSSTGYPMRSSLATMIALPLLAELTSDHKTKNELSLAHHNESQNPRSSTTTLAARMLRLDSYPSILPDQSPGIEEKSKGDNLPDETSSVEEKTDYKDISTGVVEAEDSTSPFTSLAIASQCGYVPEILKPNQDRAGYVTCFGGHSSRLFCGVYDGHGGKGHEVSAWLLTHLPDQVAHSWPKDQSESRSAKAMEDAGVSSFEKANDQLCASGINVEFSGSTAVACVLDGRTLHTFNLGDSRAVLGRRVADKINTVKPLTVTKDQKPSDPDEEKRIVAAGGRCALQNPDEPEAGVRVWKKDADIPGLAVSRAFGDLVGRECGIVATPEPRTIQLTEADEFLVLGSDGIWEFLPESFVVDIVSEATDAAQACDRLIGYAANMWFSQEGSSDDITVVVVFLPGRKAIAQRPDSYWHRYGSVVESEG
eukprot:gb/GEZN01001494.1/.p1 GENE.gb/GEZN01001494.1/~~gb/GEZN01001494.1/.p1  ORF type:complete len:959 (-),score=87.37 gb/GEZN01001494.1/:110-2986(-)